METYIENNVDDDSDYILSEHDSDITEDMIVETNEYYNSEIENDIYESLVKKQWIYLARRTIFK